MLCSDGEPKAVPAAGLRLSLEAQTRPRRGLRAALCALPAGSQVSVTPLSCPCGNHCRGWHCQEQVCCLLLSCRESGFVCFQKRLLWHMCRRQKLSMAGWGWFLVEVVHRLQKSKEMPWLWSVVLGLLEPIMQQLQGCLVKQVYLASKAEVSFTPTEVRHHLSC